MRTIFNWLAIAFVAIMGLGACTSQEDGVKPTIELTFTSSTSTSITLSVDAKNATKCAYYIYDGDVVSVDDIFAKGKSFDLASKDLSITNLESDKIYYIVAAAKNDNGVAMSNTISAKTKDANDPGNGNFELPEIDGVENIVIEKTNDGRWYEPYNYYVTFVRDNGDRIILDFYTIDETMSSYLPYGNYTLASDMSPYTIHPEASRYVPVGVQDVDGYLFTDAYISVDVANGHYSIYMMLTYDENGTEKSIQAYYNGLMSGASVPQGDNTGSDKLIEVLEVGSTSFKFRINAEEGQYWRCSVVDKRVYDQTASNPGAWVVLHGFMLQGTLTFDWVNGKMCEHVPGLLMEATSSTDYLILAALMDYSDGEENNLLGGVEIVQIHTEAEAAGTGTVDINIKEINRHDVVFDCILGENVWGCYVAMMETSNLQEVKDGKYAMAGYSSYEECMLSLIPGLSHDFKRQFLESTYDYKWDSLKYNTSYTICIKVEDMDGGVSFIELEPFTTLQ